MHCHLNIAASSYLYFNENYFVWAHNENFKASGSVKNNKFTTNQRSFCQSSICLTEEVTLVKVLPDNNNQLKTEHIYSKFKHLLITYVKYRPTQIKQKEMRKLNEDENI